jgi:hypothetical protein
MLPFSAYKRGGDRRGVGGTERQRGREAERERINRLIFLFFKKERRER